MTTWQQQKAHTTHRILPWRTFKAFSQLCVATAVVNGKSRRIPTNVDVVTASAKAAAVAVVDATKLLFPSIRI